MSSFVVFVCILRDAGVRGVVALGLVETPLELLHVADEQRREVPLLVPAKVLLEAQAPVVRAQCLPALRPRPVSPRRLQHSIASVVRGRHVVNNMVVDCLYDGFLLRRGHTRPAHLQLIEDGRHEGADTQDRDNRIDQCRQQHDGALFKVEGRLEG